MNYLIHGDNIILSREKFSELIKEFKKTGGKDIVRLDNKNITDTDLTQALESTSLFGTDKLVIIERLFSLPRSKRKDKLVSLLANTKLKTQVILWEQKEVTATNLKKLSSFKPILFKTPAAIFKFLNSFKPQNSQTTLNILHHDLKTEPKELVFYMLSRRISDLIIAKDNQASNLLKGAPWQKTTLISQAKNFKLDQLIHLHQQLINIDYSVKSGTALLPLGSQLDLLLAKI